VKKPGETININVSTRRTERLSHDFYITRMYCTSAKQWYRVVWLVKAFWSLLNGKPTPVAYENIWQVLPGVAQITLHRRDFVVVLYDEWKQRIIARQTERGMD